MNPALLFGLTHTTQKQAYFVMATLVVIVSLPVMAVFSLGTTVLSILDFGSSSGGYVYQGSLSTTDTYVWGNCTYWVSLLRQQAGKAIPNTWGNANTWASRAVLDGYMVDHTPVPTAVMQTTAGALGHVAYVAAVNPLNGDWTISEMNAIGLDVVDRHTYPASAAKRYSFIHDKEVKAL